MAKRDNPDDDGNILKRNLLALSPKLGFYNSKNMFLTFWIGFQSGEKGRQTGIPKLVIMGTITGFFDCMSFILRITLCW